MLEFDEWMFFFDLDILLFISSDFVGGFVLEVGESFRFFGFIVME